LSDQLLRQKECTEKTFFMCRLVVTSDYGRGHSNGQHQSSSTLTKALGCRRRTQSYISDSTVNQMNGPDAVQVMQSHRPGQLASKIPHNHTKSPHWFIQGTVIVPFNLPAKRRPQPIQAMNNSFYILMEGAYRVSGMEI